MHFVTLKVTLGFDSLKLLIYYQAKVLFKCPKTLIIFSQSEMIIISFGES